MLESSDTGHFLFDWVEFALSFYQIICGFISVLGRIDFHDGFNTEQKKVIHFYKFNFSFGFSGCWISIAFIDSFRRLDPFGILQ
jgi:hypothetical protein